MEAAREARAGFVKRANEILGPPLQVKRPILNLMPEVLASRQAPTSLMTRELQTAEKVLLEAGDTLARKLELYRLSALMVKVAKRCQWADWLVATKYFVHNRPGSASFFLGAMLAVGFAAYNWHDGKSSQYIATHFVADLIPGKAGLICSGALMCQDVMESIG